jgi:predicted transcriptional regulator of viral defense system
MARTTDDVLAGLPDTFRHAEALERISDRQLRRLLADGQITALSRGLYRKSDWLGDDDLIEIAAKSPNATICLRSALARHELIDDIPSAIDIALPRGSWTPETTAPVRWRHFDRDS